MADFWLWSAFVLLGLVAPWLARANPLLGYSRTILFGLVVLSLVATSLAIGITVFADPLSVPSGVFED